MQDIDDDQSSDSESDDDNAESGEEGALESENEDDNDASNEEEWSSAEAKSDASDNEDDAVASAEAALKKVKDAVKKLIPYNVEELEKVYTVIFLQVFYFIFGLNMPLVPALS
jgi:cobalamin biosynthesis protein CobT